MAVLLLALPALAGDKPAKKVVGQPPPPKLTTDNRFAILRYLDAEKVHIRKSFPMGRTGLTLSPSGEISPNGRELTDLLAEHGTAAKPGDLAVITKVAFTGHSIVFEINGGPRKKGHWYQHIQIGTDKGMSSVAPSNDNGDNAIGSALTLEFGAYIPDLTVNQVKTLLEPVFDFNAHSSAEAYASSLPPKIRLAIEQHRVLVGMDREMVAAALGKPGNKIREKDDQGKPYEEWIYGQPPEDVQFVRFVNDEVVRVELMKVDGQRIVRTEREVDAQPAAAQAPAAPAAPGQSRPTLRRPGEAPPDNAPGSIQNGPVIMPPDSSAPGIPNAPPPNAPPGGQTPPTPNGPN